MVRARPISASDDESEARDDVKNQTPYQEEEPGEDEEQGEEDGEEEGEEYEIEGILDAKRGVFPEGRMGYLCKWRNFDESYNSWVDEHDAANAHDLIADFWARQKKEKSGGRKSVEAKAAAKKDTTRSASAEVATARKRGRKPEPVDDVMDVDEEDDPPTSKKGRKSTLSTSAREQKKGRKSTRLGQDEDSSDFVNMDKYKNFASWESLIERIDTVERTSDGTLLVYFTLKKDNRHGRVKSEICKQKFPLMLLNFYESNLRWRMAEGSPEGTS